MVELIIVLPIVIGVALIVYGILRPASGGGGQRQDPGHGVDVVWHIDPSHRGHHRDINE